MRNHLRRLTIAVVAILSLGLAIQPLAAQPSPDQLLTSLEGLQTAYSRKYIADRELGFVTPVVADASTPDVLLITVLEFDTEDNATSAFDGVMNGLVARMILGEPDMDMEESSIDGLGDQALLYTGTADFANEPRNAALLAVRDGNLGFLITTHGGDASTLDLMQEFAASMIEAEPGDREITIQDGLASGSTFDIMPGRDVYEESGLVPMYDYDLLGPGGEEHPLESAGHDHATPAASPAE